MHIYFIRGAASLHSLGIAFSVTHGLLHVFSSTTSGTTRIGWPNMATLNPRHSSMEMPENGYMVYHWGYGNEVLPCESDQTTCEYLDGVYKMHDVSMTYSFIMWGVLLGIAVVWVALRGWRMGGPSQKVGGVIDGLCDRLGRLRRRWLLKDTPLRLLFGRTTRLQVAILAIMSGYLLIFS